VKVIAEAHPDSTTTPGRLSTWWRVRKLPRPVTLEEIRKDKRLGGMERVRISCLSVQAGVGGRVAP
jgi:predicted RNA-binding protein with PUA-like domain